MHRRRQFEEADNAAAHAVEALRIELAGLRDAIDELREEIAWGNRNCKGYNPMLFRFRQPDDEPDAMLAELPSVPPAAVSQPQTDTRHGNIPCRQEKLWKKFAARWLLASGRLLTSNNGQGIKSAPRHRLPA